MQHHDQCDYKSYGIQITENRELKKMFPIFFGDIFFLG